MGWGLGLIHRGASSGRHGGLWMKQGGQCSSQFALYCCMRTCWFGWGAFGILPHLSALSDLMYAWACDFALHSRGACNVGLPSPPPQLRPITVHGLPCHCVFTCIPPASVTLASGLASPCVRARLHAVPAARAYTLHRPDRPTSLALTVHKSLASCGFKAAADGRLGLQSCRKRVETH